MTSSKMRPLVAVVFALFTACQQARADWAQSTDPLVVSASPGNYQEQAQNPPTFTWSRHPTNFASYTLEIRQGATVIKTFVTDRNWYLPSQVLAAGTYTWRVRPTSSANDWSTERQFVISAASRPFVVPENADLKKTLLARARPRSLPASLPAASAWSAALKAERGNALLGLTNEVLAQTTKVPQASDASWPLVATVPATAAYVAQLTSVRTQINLSSRQLEASALLYRLTADPRFLTEALRRGDELANLSPTGPTSYVNQDQGTRMIALSLLKAIDYLGSAVDATRKAKWLARVEARTQDIYADLAGSNGRLDQQPFDSHGGNNLGFLAVIATLSLGDIPAASTWFDFSVRAYASSLMVWSGPEGGFSNGTAYGEYAVDYALQIWQPLQQALGINLFDKPWSQGFMRFFAQFVPPSSKTHLFGDAQEMPPEFKFMKSYASRFSSPEAAWYARNLTGNEDNLTLLVSPYPLPVSTATTVSPPPNSALYPSIGWAAMHSNLADTVNRTSLYFKSSPFGSFTHGHGDQNAFVLASGGVPLLTATGWYDWFGSPLSESWYRQTKAANAVTFDGGVGQLTSGYRETLQRNGAVTAFSTTSALDFVQGDATPAYGGALTAATRQLWYLRNVDAVVVRDWVAATVKHSYEWNFHALAPITVSGLTANVTTQGRSVCITPITTAGLRLDKKVGPPPKPGTVEDHAAYVMTATALSNEFLVLLDVGCKKPAVKLTTSGTSRSLQVGTQTITLPN